MFMRIALKLTLILAFSLLLYTDLTRLGVPDFVQREAPRASESPLTPEAVVMHLKGLSQLNCARSTVQTIVTSEEATLLFGFPVGNTKLLYVALSEVRAGIKLSEIDVSRLSISDSVNLTLPQARILDTKIDIKRSFVYDGRQSIFFAPDEMPLQFAAQQEALKRVEEAALQTGLLDLATQNAAGIVRKLVEAIVDKEVTVLVE